MYLKHKSVPEFVPSPVGVVTQLFCAGHTERSHEGIRWPVEDRLAITGYNVQPDGMLAESLWQSLDGTLFRGDKNGWASLWETMQRHRDGFDFIHMGTGGTEHSISIHDQIRNRRNAKF